MCKQSKQHHYIKNLLVWKLSLSHDKQDRKLYPYQIPGVLPEWIPHREDAV